MGGNDQERERAIFHLYEVGIIYLSSISSFLTRISFGDPFNHPIKYTSTDKALIDRVAYAGKRLLSPHTQLLQMLLSRFQSVRYRRSGLMLVLLRLILRSTKAHKSFRYSLLFDCIHSDRSIVQMRWPVKVALLSLSLVSRL